MPLSIPSFVQYQAPMFPLRGLWNKPPVEGDQFVNAEIDWLVSPPGSAVQFSLSGNSPVALSQIVALSVDNGRCGVDVDFIFPDSGFVLTVAAHNQGIFPVFTNALMFYASAPGCAIGDTTIIQILNSMPPPIPIAPTEAQNRVGASGASTANGSTTLVAAPASGTLNSLSFSGSGLGVGNATVTIQDGTGKIIWATAIVNTTAGANINVPVTGINVRFTGGLVAVVSGSTIASGVLVYNAYYTTP